MLSQDLTVLALRLSNGRFLEIPKMSIFDRIDYLYYLQRLMDYMSQYPDVDIAVLYLEHAEFKHLADSCLNLAGIPGDKLTSSQMTELLFASKKYPYGLLNQFNFTFRECSGGEPDTKGSLLAKLYKSLGNLDQALTMAKDIPSDILEDFLKTLRPPEDTAKEKALEYIKKHGVPLPVSPT